MDNPPSEITEDVEDGKSADGVVEEGKFKRRPTRSISKSFQTEQPQTMLSKVDSKKRLGSQSEKKEAEPVSFLAATREKASDKQKLSLSTLAIENSTQSNQNTPPRKQMFSLSTLSDGKTSAATASLIDFLDEFKENDQKEKQQQQQRVNRTNSTAGEPMVQPKSKEIDFSVKDSDDNIIFMDGSNELIKAATFSKLIERLTCATGYLDPDDFLFSYRLFATAQEVLEAIFKRYNSTEEKAIRIRIFNFFKRWIEKFWHDFEREPQNAVITLEFVDPIIAHGDSVYLNLAKMVRTKIEQRQKEGPTDIPRAAAQVKCDPSLTAMGILEYSAQDIANQLTEIEWNMWVNIRETELLGLGWTKKNKLELSPNVVNMTKRFNEVSDWVASVIITEENPKKRNKLIVKFIEIAECLKKIGNYNGVMEIFSAFQRGPVARLKQSFGSLDSKTEKSYLEINNLTNNAKNYSTLRLAIAEINPPVLPYLGMYLTDILFAIEGNGPYINGLINFFRCRIYSENIKRIKQYQLKSFENPIIPHLYESLNKLSSLEENDLYTISSYIEPREGKEPGPRPSKLIDDYLDLTRGIHGSIEGSKQKKTEKKAEKDEKKKSKIKIENAPSDEVKRGKLERNQSKAIMKKSNSIHSSRDELSEVSHETKLSNSENDEEKNNLIRELKLMTEANEAQKKMISDLQMELSNKQKELDQNNVASLIQIVSLQNKLTAITEEFEAYKKDHP